MPKKSKKSDADGQRLWEKGEALDQSIHEFTVGNDPELDLRLAKFDVLASAAHAKMLHKIELLDEEELFSLLKQLEAIYKEIAQGKFSISRELEDCHTAIEAKLVSSIGEAGKKIHTGRSRNDQVLVATRMFLKSSLHTGLSGLSFLAKKLLTRSAELWDTPMPGYTHFQPAMPSSVGMLLHAYAEHVLELIRSGLVLGDLMDSNPLGAAAGFGVPIKLDKEMTSLLLGFSRAQRNPIAIQNSRGRFELQLVRWCEDIGSFVEKASWDFIIYSSAEYGYFSLPVAFTTGSSIMPQKRNPDVLELLRARASKIRGAQAELSALLSKLPSHYHRDFQYTKEPLFRALDQVYEMIPVLAEVVESFAVNEKTLAAAMTPELFATYDAYREVKNGKAFRDAYKSTADKVKQGKIDPKDFEEEYRIVMDAAEKERKAALDELQVFSQEIQSFSLALSEMEEDLFRC